MAKAEVKTDMVTKMVETEVEENTVVLTLTEREAFVIKWLVGNVNGGGEVRRATSAIYDALGEANVDRHDKMTWTGSNSRLEINVNDVSFPEGV